MSGIQASFVILGSLSDSWKESMEESSRYCSLVAGAMYIKCKVIKLITSYDNYILTLTSIYPSTRNNPLSSKIMIMILFYEYILGCLYRFSLQKRYRGLRLIDIIYLQIKMYRLRTQTNANNRRLEIKIPNFNSLDEKAYKQTLKLHKSKSSTQPLKQKSTTHNIQSPSQKGNNYGKLLKIKWQSQSPKNRSKSPAFNQSHTSRMAQKDAFHSNINSVRNVDNIRSKLREYKAPIKLNRKHFKKQLNINDKLQDMNKTLKKVAELKNTKKPKYELKMLKRLGKSQTGEIILAISNVNNIIVALKCFRRQKVKLQFLIQEMKIHLYCQHPNILPAYGYHIGKQEVFLVMEYGYNNLYEQILRTGPFDQEKTAKFLFQITSGIEYLHRNGIMHRDLKPQNIICFGDHLKITDFGWSTKTDKQRRTLCGTLDYISPEVAQRNYYDNKIDCWSIGVLMYQMLMVQAPFIQQAQKYDFSSFRLPIHFSQNCKDLLTKLIQIDPKKRLNAKQTLQHPFFETFKKQQILTQRKKYRQLRTNFEMIFNFQ